jgi:hypothetical protein
VGVILATRGGGVTGAAALPLLLDGGGLGAPVRVAAAGPRFLAEAGRLACRLVLAAGVRLIGGPRLAAGVRLVGGPRLAASVRVGGPGLGGEAGS